MARKNPKARELGEPIYEVIHREMNGLTLVVARETDNSARQIGIYPVSEIQKLGLTKTIWIDVGPAGIISFYDSKSIDQLICEIEDLGMGDYSGLCPGDASIYINGFEVGSLTGNRKEEHKFEFPIQFYQVKVDRKLNFLEYDRMKKLIDKIGLTERVTFSYID